MLQDAVLRLSSNICSIDWKWAHMVIMDIMLCAISIPPEYRDSDASMSLPLVIGCEC